MEDPHVNPVFNEVVDQW